MILWFIFIFLLPLRLAIEPPFDVPCFWIWQVKQIFSIVLKSIFLWKVPKSGSNQIGIINFINEYAQSNIFSIISQHISKVYLNVDLTTFNHFERVRDRGQISLDAYLPEYCLPNPLSDCLWVCGGEEIWMLEKINHCELKREIILNWKETSLWVGKEKKV